MKTFFLGLLSILTCIGLHSQDSDGMLWRISGKELKTASYIFGTVHLYCNDSNIYKPEIVSAMDSSQVVAMELNLNDFSTIVALMKSGMKSSGKSLKNLLTASQYRVVDNACRSLIGDSLENHDNKSPMSLLSAFIVSGGLAGCMRPLPVDFVIAGMAKESGKISYGLETFDFQDSLLNSIPDSTQVRWLVEFCSDTQKAKAELSALLEAYDLHQSSRVYDLMFKTSPEMQYFNDLLLVKRNIKWVDFLQANMKEKPYFMAVGAGHLAGNDGLVSLLRKAGYNVTPIRIR
jgi:uncharacterized protein YbaP (TraB family)